MALIPHSRETVEQAMELVMQRWQPQHAQREAFVGWAQGFLCVTEALAEGDSVHARRDLESARDQLHDDIADLVMEFGHIDHERVSQLAWVSWCIAQLEDEVEPVEDAA